MLSRTATLAVAALALSALTPFQASALTIALTNDDGWSSVGVQAMKRALVASGHDVYLVAPLDEQSGSSGAINTGALEVVKQHGPEHEGAYEFAVKLAGEDEGAEPATSAAVGMGLVLQATGSAPDLVVSGINAGQNLGAATQISGTVGAAVAGLSSGLGGGRVPAVAISTDDFCAEATPECEAANDAHYARVAGFTATLIDGLDKGGELTPQGVGLNINYPAIDPVEGAVVAVQGRTFTTAGAAISLEYGCYADCLGAEIGAPTPAGITGAPAVDVEEPRKADTTLNAEGYVTIVPITPDYTAIPSNENVWAIARFTRKINKVIHQMGMAPWRRHSKHGGKHWR